MPAITAAAVKSLRERTGLPMMDCKKALSECEGDEEAAVDWLRKQGLKTMEKRSGRDTDFGRMGLYAGVDKPVGAMVELKCESAPVTQNARAVTATPTSKNAPACPRGQSANKAISACAGTASRGRAKHVWSPMTSSCAALWKRTTEFDEPLGCRR